MHVRSASDTLVCGMRWSMWPNQSVRVTSSSRTRALPSPCTGRALEAGQLRRVRQPAPYLHCFTHCDPCSQRSASSELQKLLQANSSRSMLSTSLNVPCTSCCAIYSCLDSICICCQDHHPQCCRLFQQPNQLVRCLCSVLMHTQKAET